MSPERRHPINETSRKKMTNKSVSPGLRGGVFNYRCAQTHLHACRRARYAAEEIDRDSGGGKAKWKQLWRRIPGEGAEEQDTGEDAISCGHNKIYARGGGGLGEFIPACVGAEMSPFQLQLPELFSDDQWPGRGPSRPAMTDGAYYFEISERNWS